MTMPTENLPEVLSLSSSEEASKGCEAGAPAQRPEKSCADKIAMVKRALASKGRVLISYSGGVDSSLLARIARDALGDDALCVILDTETYPRRELEEALSFARSMGFNCQVVRYSALEDPAFKANPADRCYLCKKTSARVLKKIAGERGIEWIVDGVNLSDYGDYRPGITACREEGIWHPFADLGISKEDIRAMAREMSLPFWDKPSSACLSSRIPYGEPLSIETLNMVEVAEDFLRGLGLRQARVRAHGMVARIEVLDHDVGKVLFNKDPIVRAFKELGFDYVALDLEGFRSGSMNEVLNGHPKN